MHELLEIAVLHNFHVSHRKPGVLGCASGMGTVGLLARDFYPIHAFHHAAPGSSSSLSQRGCPSFWHLGLLVFSPPNTSGAQIFSWSCPSGASCRCPEEQKGCLKASNRSMLRFLSDLHGHFPLYLHYWGPMRKGRTECPLSPWSPATSLEGQPSDGAVPTGK